MLAAKKKLAEKKRREAEARAAAAAAAAAGGAAAGGAGGGGDDEAAGGERVQVLGPQSLTGRKGTGKRKLSPGEIRVRKDIDELDAGRVAEVEWPNPKNLMEMKLTVKPDDGLWAGGTFEMSISVPKLYPHQPPLVKCETPIYHPNIDWDGNVCLNILRADWKPVLDLNAVIYGLIFLFYEPNANDPLNHEAAELLRRDAAQFASNVERSLRGQSISGHQFPRQK